MRIVSADELANLLTMPDVIALMREVFVERGEGRAEIPERAVTPLPGTNDVVLVMPGALPARRAVGVKVVGVFPDNPARHGLPVITGEVFVVDPDTGAVALALDGAWVTAMRTGAVTGLATDLLARADAAHLVVFGTGPQARTQIEAVCAVRPIRRITLCGRDTEKAARVAERERAGRPGVACDVASSPDAAVASADVIVTATSARSPVFDGRRLRPGVHVNAIGAFTRDTRELDTDAITRGRVYVDDREHAWREAGDLRIPHDEGLFEEAAIVGDLGALVCGACDARTDPGQITVFKSVGLSIEDIAVAARIRELTR